jgi:hypothetical protein
VNLDDVDGRFGEAWAGTAPNGSHINLVIGRRGSPTAAAETDHRERAREILASRETARNRFYRGS